MRTLQIDTSQGKLQLPKLILGTSQFGTRIDEKTSFALMDRYFELGGFCLDTASVYGDWDDTGDPVSERTIGKWLRLTGCRADMRIITKGAHYRLKRPQISRVSAACIEADIEKSLDSLQVEAIDVYLLHRDNPDVEVGDILHVLHQYVASGRIKAIGASNWTMERILEANRFAAEQGLTPFTVSQIQWSLAMKTAEQTQGPFGELLPNMTDDEYAKYTDTGLPVLAWSSQASGIIQKVVADGWDGVGGKWKALYFNERNLRIVEKVRRLMAKAGISATQASLGYISCNPLPAAALIGPSTLAHLQDSMTAADLALDAEEVKSLVE